jgi:hypothetical protein
MKKLKLILFIGASVFLINMPMKGYAGTTMGGNNGALNILIDGDFSDWNSFPKTVISQYNPTDTSGQRNAYKYGSLIADNENIYFYIRMTEAGSNTYIVPASYLLKVGTTTFALQIADKSGASMQFDSQTLAVGEKEFYRLRAQTQGGSSTTISSSDAPINDPDVKVAVSRTPNSSNDNLTGFTDEMEVKIPFKDLGLTNNNISQVITLQNYSLGSQVLSTSGGSTGPFLLSVIGFIVVIIGGIAYKKKKIN